MSILNEILEWTKSLPAWQSDCVSRLLANPLLTTADLEDLYALLKVEHGIPDSKNRTPKPLTAAQIPAPSAVANHIELHAIKNLEHVNAIASSHSLPFNPSGLTVIYGDNGSGKSGYSRVLKRACRARDQSEVIHPNANLLLTEAEVPKATFEISVNGTLQDREWIDGETAPPDLSSFSIFDSRCAHAYIDSEDDFSYVPYGLHVFDGLAKACQSLKALIDDEYAQSETDLTPFLHLKGDTAVGQLISNLSAKTPTAEIDTLANLKSEDVDRYAELESSLKENNPKEKAIQLRLRASRFSTIAKNALDKESLVDQVAVSKLRKLSDNFHAARAAAALAAKQFNESENLLPGTGGEAWRELFEAARKFALESHQGKEFPELGEGEPCPLCQQPLMDGASRLLRFEGFIQQEAEKNAQVCRKALAAQRNVFVELNLTFNFDDITYGEIEAVDRQLAVDIRKFESELIARKKTILASLTSNNWDDSAQELKNPATRLQNIVESLNAEAESLERASDELARESLQKEFNELDSRLKMSQVKDALKIAVARLIHQSKLSECLSSIRTNNISLKASELAEKVVSSELAKALNQEFKALGVGSLQVSLQSRSHKGKALHKLMLELPQNRSPVDILSEGEQRAIAIGSFLAEVKLSGGKGGVVFDDPVSSLDHRRRERVAKRLAQEAEDRQVVVFTHDIYFLCLLLEEAKRAGVSFLTQSLIRTIDGFGVADPELPFEGKTTSKRIGALKAQHQFIAKLHRDGNEQEYIKQTVDAYFRLRMAWERGVEEVLLREVILRFRKGVETQRLVGVMIEDDDFTKVHNGMTKCSNYAHDKALIGGIAVPDPDELLTDIMELENWRGQIEKRSLETIKRRRPN